MLRNRRMTPSPAGPLGPMPFHATTLLGHCRLGYSLAALRAVDLVPWDIGGAVDVLYGTDYQFLQSRGLETHGDFTNNWNSDDGSGLNGVVQRVHVLVTLRDINRGRSLANANT